MNNLAKAAARRIVKEFSIRTPEDIILEDIAGYYYIDIEEKEIEGSEGRIIRKGNAGIIAVNSKIYEPSRKRFVIAHELGHFSLHKDVEAFSCDNEDFIKWNQKGAKEYEANTFAAELLMPEEIFRKYDSYRGFSLDIIRKIAISFSTSIAATCLRYSDIGRYAICAIFCRDGKIVWYSVNKNFPLKYIDVGAKVPNDSYTSDYFKGDKTPTEPETIPASVWFYNDHNLMNYREFYEQCYELPRYNGVLSLIWEK